MYKGVQIIPPFFEIGPKCYLYGDQLLDLAHAADRAAKEHDIQIIFDPPASALSDVVRCTNRILVFAQHLDPIRPGRGMAAMLPESLKAAGAVGALLNHIERPMSVNELAQAIVRADEVGLVTMVCSDSVQEAAAIAHFAPNIIVVEPKDRIGSNDKGSHELLREAVQAVHAINSEIIVFPSAGIRNGEDVYDVIRAGANGTGSSSAIAAADDPAAMVDEMVSAVRAAWNDRKAKE